jgi:adenylate kinase
VNVGKGEGSGIEWHDRLVLGFSGPDGAGKTTVLGKVREALQAEGLAVQQSYGYGCIMCRHIDGPSRVTRAAFIRGAALNRQQVPKPAIGRAGHNRVRAMVTDLLRSAHGHVDALELGGRLFAFRFAAQRWLTGCVLLTDRGPLDGLAKHDPPPGSALARRYVRAATNYDAFLLLDAPADVLAKRDREHSAEQLEHWRLLYRRWATIAGTSGVPVVLINTADKSADTIADYVVRLVKR